MKNTIYILTIPHQMPATLTAFNNLQEALNAYEVSSLEELEEAALYDMSGASVFTSSEIEDVKNRYRNGHQWARISSLLGSL